MRTIFIVIESRGSYEDSCTNIIGCSLDQKKATEIGDEHEKKMWALRDIPFPCNEEVEELYNNSKYDDISAEDWDIISDWQTKREEGNEFNRVYVEAYDII
jgi:hypothetical protein